MLKTIAICGLIGFLLLLLLLLVMPLYSISATTTTISQTPQLSHDDRNRKSFWTNGSPVPTPRTEVSATSIGDAVYFIGGFDAYGQPTNMVEV